MKDAGVTITEGGVTTTEGGMETSQRRRYAQETGRSAPRLPNSPLGLVIPAKAGTHWMRLAYAKAGTYPPVHVIPAKAGTYWRRRRLQYPLPPRSRRPLPF